MGVAIGVGVGVILGAFVWTPLAIRECEREFAQRMQRARRYWETAQR